jgi:hypothetical protein
MKTADLNSLSGPYPSGPIRGPALDWFAYQAGKTPQRLKKWFSGRRIRPHHEVLKRAVSAVLECFPEPVCLETGCIRRSEGGTDSTLAIAAAIADRGRFYSFEIDPTHIELCKQKCRDLNDHIQYVQGDAKVNLRRLRDEGKLEAVHLAFFDSADDPEQIWEEFKAVEDLFVAGSLVIVDDAIRGVKGKRIKPYLRTSDLWSTRLVYAGNGMLLARKNGRNS